MNEVWRDIAGYENLYQVSNLGRVKSLYNRNGHIMKLYTSDANYLYALLSDNGKQKPFSIHRLVAKAFIPNPENKPEVNHINGDKHDNRAENLEWCTRRENITHAFKTGLSAQGENSHNAKLTNKQVRYIRENPYKLKGYELAKMFGVHEVTISEIQRGKRYKSAGGTIRGKKKIPENLCQQIKQEYNPHIRGYGCTALSKKFGVCKSTIWKIVREQY